MDCNNTEPLDLINHHGFYLLNLWMLCPKHLFESCIFCHQVFSVEAPASDTEVLNLKTVAEYGVTEILLPQNGRNDSWLSTLAK